MKDVRPRVDEADARDVVKSCIGRSGGRATRLGSGQIAATFECDVRNESYVVQFNHPSMADSVFKESFVRIRTEPDEVPLRDVMCVGMYEGLQFTVSRKATGVELQNLSQPDCEAALPSTFRVLVAMSQVDLGGTEGFGWFDRDGRGRRATWREHLLQVAEEEVDGFYGKWHNLFETTFLERERFDRYLNTMTELLEQFDAPRQLVHGGYGYDNVIIDGTEVTAVLDWQDARFGDGLFDVAYMDFWSQMDTPSRFERYCREIGVTHEHLKERVLCYKHYIALDAMRFFAKTDNRSAYDSTIEVIERVRA